MSEEISNEKLMELYLDTLHKCGLHLLDMENHDVEYDLFEEFDIGAMSFLHENTLSKLKKAGLIDTDIEKRSIDLRNAYMEIQDSNEYNIESVKASDNWKKIMKMSDEIKSLIQYSKR